MLWKKLAILFFFCALAFVVRAQEVQVYEEFADEPSKVKLIGFNLNGLFPQATFKRNIGDKKGFGVGGLLLYQVQPLSPHFLGLDIEYDHLYGESSTVNGVEERISSGYTSINFLWRIYPNVKLWKFEPYLETYLGPNFIFTSTNVVDESGQSIDFSFNETNFGLEYGIAAGLTFPMGQGWFLDVQFSRTQTSIAQYLVLPDANSNFQEINSANDHNKLKVGAVYAF